MNKTSDIHSHFSRIAPRYHHLRTTDLEPVDVIVRELDKLDYVKAADIGCGAGRYDRALIKHMGDRLSLTCVDANADMLEALNRNCVEDGIRNITVVNGSAENLPLENDCYDCIFTFNAVHHFNLAEFMRQCSRALKTGGYLFIYTRLRDQNRRNIWGRYFPAFHQKETRLYTLGRLVQLADAHQSMWLESIEFFKYGRLSSLPQLVERARSHHYSTFFLYTEEDLEKAIERFNDNIARAFRDVHKVHWYDENVMLVVRKEQESVDDPV